MSPSRSRRGDGASLHERALVLAAQRADRRALEELLRRYEPLARAVAARLHVPPGCDRHDIAQEARLGVLSAIAAWRPDRGPFRALAARCAMTRALKALDAAGARKHQVLSQALPWDSSALLRDADHELVFTIPIHERLAITSPHGDPVATLLTREQLAEIRAAVPTLTARERIMLAGVLNDRSHCQLAAEHGTSAKAVGAAVARARRKLSDGEVVVHRLDPVGRAA